LRIHNIVLVEVKKTFTSDSHSLDNKENTDFESFFQISDSLHLVRYLKLLDQTNFLKSQYERRNAEDTMVFEWTYGDK